MLGWWKSKKPERVAELEGLIECYQEIQRMHLAELERHREIERARVADLNRRTAVLHAVSHVGAVFGARMAARNGLDREPAMVAACHVFQADPLLHAAMVLADTVENTPDGHRTPAADALLALRGVVGSVEPEGRAVDAALCELSFMEDGEGEG